MKNVFEVLILLMIPGWLYIVYESQKKSEVSSVYSIEEVKLQTWVDWTGLSVKWEIFSLTVNSNIMLFEGKKHIWK